MEYVCRTKYNIVRVRNIRTKNGDSDLQLIRTYTLYVGWPKYSHKKTIQHKIQHRAVWTFTLFHTSRNFCTHQNQRESIIATIYKAVSRS